MPSDSSTEYKEVSFPPYGVLTDGLQADLDSSPGAPADVFAGPGADRHARDEWWKKWKRETADIIAETLWPEWNPAQNVWTGASQPRMTELTVTDLHLMSLLRSAYLKAVPKSPLRAPDCPSHIDFYRAEDDGDWMAQYAFYDTTLSPDLIDELGAIRRTRAWAKHGSAPLQFKMLFQRPRPSQMSYILHKESPRPLRAISAGSPSLCSGHGLQAILSMGAVFESLLLNSIKFSDQSFCALRQHTVDIGDRRVFASLHYPGDSLSSWIIAMRLADHVFRTSEVKLHLWQAISRQSAVYQEMQGRPVYQPALDALLAAAGDAEKTLQASPFPEC